MKNDSDGGHGFQPVPRVPGWGPGPPFDPIVNQAFAGSVRRTARPSQRR
jgi:hypothetical protein